VTATPAFPRLTAAALLSVAVLVGSGGVSAADVRTAATCTPGSGPNLAGQKITAGTLAEIDSLACATLTGADLRGLNLIQQDLTGISAAGADFADARLGQADLPGAVLTGADLSGADLTQATLTGADLSSVNAAGADFGQVHAAQVRFTRATLSDASFVQATVTDADFDGAALGGADFTQASTDGAAFAGVQGLIPWSRYLLIATIMVFLLCAFVAVRRALRRRRPVELYGSAPTRQVPWVQPAMVGYPTGSWSTSGPPIQAPDPYGSNEFQPINGRPTRSVGRGIGVGLLAAAVIAFGFHLFVGALIGVFSFAFDTLATVTCTGPTCAVGIDAGMIGPWAGIFAMVAGLWVLAKA
jgi:uncharacterized protein YjbI with pentapeptide repeats